jgi:hypothetical protein
MKGGVLYYMKLAEAFQVPLNTPHRISGDEPVQADGSPTASECHDTASEELQSKIGKLACDPMIASVNTPCTIAYVLLCMLSHVQNDLTP